MGQEFKEQEFCTGGVEELQGLETNSKSERPGHCEALWDMRVVGITNPFHLGVFARDPGLGAGTVLPPIPHAAFPA